ncbi:MAG: VanZ family protein [Bryobacteraceae bacterium]
MLRIALLIAVLIVHGSLYPWEFRTPSGTGNPWLTLLHAWQPVTGRRLIFDAAANVFFYVPLGVVLFAALTRRLRPGTSAAVTLLAAAALSASMEMAQLFVPHRDCSATDVLFNLSGAALGVLAAMAPAGRLRPAVLARLRGDSPEAVLLLGCWMVAHLFPLIPETHRLVLLAKGKALAHPAGFQWIEAAVAATEWLAAARLARLAGGCGRVLLLLLLVLPAKVFMAGRTVTWPELAGAIAGLALVGIAARRWVAPALLAGAVVLRGLEPFASGAARAVVHWTPFEVFIAGNWDMAFAMLARKVFWYGAILWLFCGAGMRLAAATGALAVLLAGIEACQVFLPGHVVESTDPVLAVLMGLVFLFMRRKQKTAGTLAPPLQP